MSAILCNKVVLLKKIKIKIMKWLVLIIFKEYKYPDNIFYIFCKQLLYTFIFSKKTFHITLRILEVQYVSLYTYYFIYSVLLCSFIRQFNVLARLY